MGLFHPHCTCTLVRPLPLPHKGLPLAFCFMALPSFLPPSKCLMALMLEIWLYLYHSRDIVLPKVITNNLLSLIHVLLFFSTQPLNMGIPWASFPCPFSSLYSVPEWSHLLLSTDDFKSYSPLKPLSCAPDSNFRLPIWCFPWRSKTSDLKQNSPSSPSLLFLFPNNLVNGKTFSLTTLLTPDMWVYSHTNQSLSSAGVLQFNSVLTWPEICFRFHRLRTQSHKTATTSHASHKSQVFTSTSDKSAINQGFHSPLLGFSNLLRKTLMFTGLLYDKVYYKGHRWTARWRST